jgi:hypothetical protein
MISTGELSFEATVSVLVSGIVLPLQALIVAVERIAAMRMIMDFFIFLSICG